MTQGGGAEIFVGKAVQDSDGTAEGADYVEGRQDEGLWVTGREGWTGNVPRGTFLDGWQCDLSVPRGTLWRA